MQALPLPVLFGRMLLVLGVLGTVCYAAAEDEPTQVDVFHSGKEGYHTYRIPTVIGTPQKTLLAICEGRKTGRGDHGDLDLVLKRSRDGGKTWGPLELIYEEGGEAKITIGNPAPVVDADTGTIWLPFTRDNDDVLVTHSDDDGVTWAKPRLITADVKKPNWSWYATGPVHGIQLTRGEHKGRLVIPCDHRVKDKQGDWNQTGRSHIIYSDDHGKTWKLGGITDWGMNECTVVEQTDGSLMLNMRSYRGHGRRGVATSSDGGATWTKPVDDATLIEPVCQASLLRYTWPGEGGRSRVLYSNPASTKNRSHMTVRLSYDEGQTWPVSKILYDGSAAYSCLTALPEGQIGILYERDNYSKITFARFSLAWLTGGKDSLPSQ